MAVKLWLASLVCKVRRHQWPTWDCESGARHRCVRCGAQLDPGTKRVRGWPALVNTRWGYRLARLVCRMRGHDMRHTGECQRCWQVEDVGLYEETLYAEGVLPLPNRRHDQLQGGLKDYRGPAS